MPFTTTLGMKDSCLLQVEGTERIQFISLPILMLQQRRMMERVRKVTQLLIQAAEAH